MQFWQVPFENTFVDVTSTKEIKLSWRRLLSIRRQPKRFGITIILENINKKDKTILLSLVQIHTIVCFLSPREKARHPRTFQKCWLQLLKGPKCNKCNKSATIRTKEIFLLFKNICLILSKVFDGTEDIEEWGRIYNRSNITKASLLLETILPLQPPSLSPKFLQHIVDIMESFVNF